MIELKDIVVVIADTKNYGDCVYAINRTLKQIKPKQVVWFTDINISVGQTLIYRIPSIKDADHYSRFIINEMPYLMDKAGISFSHVLVIQHDGFVLHGQAWNHKFLEYDYVGAPWLYVDGRNVGNGGFSLRSKKLLDLTKTLTLLGPEDECLGRLWRGSLEFSGCRFAPEPIAHSFAFELNKPMQPTFGFHGCFHRPSSKTVLVKRMGAMGDVIQVEPIIRHFFEQGYTVYLLTTPRFMELFYSQPYQVNAYVDEMDYDLIADLDMAYENRPFMNHIEAYFAAIGDRPKANPPQLRVKGHLSIFPFDYVVMHIDKRPQVHRNPIEDWHRVCDEIIDSGYTIILVGEGEKLDPSICTKKGVVALQNLSIPALMSIISCSVMFVGIDSGPSHIAVASGVKSVIYFGSVKPSTIHMELTNIDVRQGKCQHQGCWHIEGGTEGQDCLLGLEIPKCCVHNEE
jgi:ADP-heptose:LPS heptosyltransferase